MPIVLMLLKPCVIQNRIVLFYVFEYSDSNDVTGSSYKTLVDIYQLARRDIPKDLNHDMNLQTYNRLCHATIACIQWNTGDTLRTARLWDSEINLSGISSEKV
jgi:hypothetical protein